MPTNSHHDAIARLLAILKKIPRKSPGISAREMMIWLNDEGYECSKRTVERDLDVLASHFPLFYEEEKSPYKWQWMPEAAPEFPGLTLADAISLHLVEDLLRPLLPVAVLESLRPHFQQAQKKLEALAETTPNARWIDKVRHVSPTLPLLPPKIADGVLETVQDALLADLQLEVAYQRPDAEEPQTMCLHPLGLVQRGPVTYLVATAFDYTDARIYAVHRIREANKLSEPAHRPEGFSLDEYIRSGALQFGNGETIQLVARVSEWLAGILSETPLSSDQRLEKTGQEYQVTASLDDTWQLCWWILAQGDAITVIEPEELRQEIAKELRRAARRYSSNKTVKKLDALPNHEDKKEG